MNDTPNHAAGFPRIDPVGLDGLLVRFGEVLDEPANRAALAFKAALEGDSPDGVEECATSLVSCFLRFDPLAVAPEVLSQRLSALLATRDWYQAALPEGLVHEVRFAPAREGHRMVGSGLFVVNAPWGLEEA